MKVTIDQAGDADEPSITFWGAASAVSGSMHLLQAGRSRLLLDYGLVQGKREEARARNSHFPFHPKELNAALVSHAHIDHCGNLPTLVRQGFSGPIYCTPATHDLLRVMLRDSAKIQEEEAAHINIARNYAEPWVQPLYTDSDVENVLDRLVSVPYGREVDALPGIRFRFAEAGHILGSAMVHARTRNTKGEERTLTFSGDLGRRGLPLLPAARDVPPADLLVCESTYGNRTHVPIAETVDKLYATIRNTVARGGKALIPAFSLGRSQLIIHYLQLALRQGLIPDVPIFVDSPLSADIADVYRAHLSSLSPDIAADVKEGHGILGGEGVTYVRDFDDSLRLATRPGPCVIIASSGMCDAGRILGHLKQHVDDPRCTVILVSYQASGTLGRRLTEQRPTVKFLGREWNKWIEVVHLEGFSGHADREDFLAYLRPLVGKVGKIRLIHGEREQALALGETLREVGFADVAVPEPGDRVPLR